MLAVVKTGGKQYIVRPGDKIKVEKLEGGENSEVSVGDVLLLENDGAVDIGKPTLEGIKIKGKIIRQARNKKVIIFKYKPKKRYKVKKGHRQHFTEVEILGFVK